MALREEHVAAAVRFLGQPRVASRPQAEQEDFLKRKGLTNEEIAEAVRRARESGEDGTGATTHPVVAPSSGQPQWPTGSGQPQQLPYAASSTAAWQTGGGGGIAPAYGAPSYQQMPSIPPWAFIPPPEPPPTPAWAWLLAGLGSAGVGFALSSLLSFWKQKSGPHQSCGVGLQAGQHALPSGGQAFDPIALQSPLQASGYPLETGTASNAVMEHANDKSHGKAAYEELVEILRKQGEERSEREAYHSKVVKEMQEQNKQLVNEMQKLLQQQMQQQKALMGKPAELSSTSIKQLAEILQPAAASSASASSTVLGGDSSTPPVGGAVPGPTGGVVPLRESFDAIGQSLQRLVRESPSKEQAAKSLQTLSMILGNLLSNPASEKHRKVNSSSDRFRVLLGQNSAASELLKLAGFQYQEPNFVFPADAAGGVETAAATRVRDLVKEAQGGLDQTWTILGTGVAPVPLRTVPTQPGTAGADVAGNGVLVSQESVSNVMGGPVAGAACLEEDRGSAGRGAAPKPWASNLGTKQGMSAPAALSTAGTAASPPAAVTATTAAPATDDVAHRSEVAFAAGSSSASSSGVGTVGQGAPTMAHPAESQEWNNPGPAIAHPAEADAFPQVARVAVPHPSGLPQATVAVAHPAESSQLSGEPQSGG